jgi:hypothetical protein
MRFFATSSNNVNISVSPKVKVMLRQTVSRPVCCLGVRYPFGARGDFFLFKNYLLTIAGLLTWGTLSDERTGVSLNVTAGPRHRIFSRARVPQDS